MTAPPLRVLHVLEATLGGTRRYLEDIAVATADLAIVQGLVYGTSRSDSAFPDLLHRLGQNGWSLFPVEMMRRPVRPLDDLRSVLAVRRAIRRFKPTIVHVHSAKAGAIGRIASRSYSASLAVCYSPHALPSRLGRLYMSAEHVLRPLTSRFVAVSESERLEIIAQGLCSPGQVDVVYPRIDTALYAPRDRDVEREALRLPDVPIVIGVGRLAPQKDPLSFVRTLARVRESHPNVLGIWIGDGELRADVEAEAARLHLSDSFRVAGWLTDVRPFIAAADVLLSTSRYESFGYVIPETFAMERPVVATRVMGTTDVFFPAAQSFLYELERYDEAASAVRTLIDDKKFASELGRIGRLSVIERFSTHMMSAALVSSYYSNLL